MNNKIVACRICNGRHHAMRDHCPYCGAKRVFLASHSFEGQHTEVTMRDASSMRCEMVRAFRSDYAFQFITAK